MSSNLRPQPLLVLASVWLLPAGDASASLGASEGGAALGTAAGVQSAAEACPGLFGDEEAREANRTRRQRLLESARRGPYTLWLVHRGDWATPRPVRVRGLELVATPRIDGERVAVVAVVDETSGCPMGRYALRVDDALGAGGRVVGVLADTLLIEVQGELSYLLVPDAETPVWRMVWHPPWRFPASRISQATPPSPARPPVRPRRR